MREPPIELEHISVSTVAVIFLLLSGLQFAQCFPKDGNTFTQLFVCEDAGCAANVSNVFCQDESVFNSSRSMPQCTGPPALNTVCELSGRAIVSTSTDATCEFEGKDGYIPTGNCADHGDICSFPATTSQPTTSPPATWKNILGIVMGVLACVGLTCLAAYFYRNRQNQQQPSFRDPDVDLPLNEVIHSESSERENNNGAESADVDPPATRHHGA